MSPPPRAPTFSLPTDWLLQHLKVSCGSLSISKAPFCFSDRNIWKCLLSPIDIYNAFIRREGKGDAYLHLDLMKPSKHNNDGDENILATNICQGLALWQLLLSGLYFSHQFCEAGTTISQLAGGETGAGRGQVTLPGDRELKKNPDSWPQVFWS